MKILLLFLISFTVLGADSDVQEMTVAAPRISNSVESLLEVRKQKNAVADVMGQETMARTGDSDAAAVLRRVTGLTLVNGKFVYVRGLGERYSSVLLNGSQVPSPEPTRRVVPLDLFPVSILENITVQKSFSPDRPAEFGGGLIELQTRSIPKDFRGQLQLGVNSNNFQNGLGYKGGSRDYLGMDDGSRAMPGSIKNAFKNRRKIIESPTDGFSKDEIVAMTNDLSNTYNVQDNASAETLPNLQFSIGDSMKISNGRAGALMGFIYQNGSDVGDRDSNAYNVGEGGKLVKEDSSTTKFAEREVQLGGALDLGVDYNDRHNLKFTTLLLRNTTNTTSEKITSRNNDSFSKYKTTTLEWSERQLWLNQLAGEHKVIDRVTTKWRYNQSTANRDSPDTRQMLRKFDGSDFILETDITGNNRVYSELEDKSREMGLDFEVNAFERGDVKVVTKFGGTRNTKGRVSDVYRLHLKDNFATGTQPDLAGSSEDIFSHRGADGFLLTSITDSADSFVGDQSINAMYGMVEVSPSEKWTFIAGARQEKSVQDVRTFKYYDPGNPTSKGNLEMDDLLPSYNLTWKATKDERVRLAYGETLARPDFRELSTVTYIEDETGYEVIGNSNLKGTVIKNMDLRYERYFQDSDSFSVGVFHKKFVSPIEAQFQPGDRLTKTFNNAKGATSYGAEAEGRYSLRGLSRSLRRWTLASNVSVIKSQVDIDSAAGNQTSKTRPLQGQSPYVANVQLFYDRPQYKVTSGLIYNVVGKRITEVGTNARPDTYEQPFNQLDFVFNQNFDRWGYGFRARNLLDPVAQSTQGNEIVRERKRGRTYVFNLTAYF